MKLSTPEAKSDLQLMYRANPKFAVNSIVNDVIIQTDRCKVYIYMIMYFMLYVVFIKLT